VTLDMKTPAAVYQSLLESLSTGKESMALETYENSVVLYDSLKKQWSLFYRPLRVYIAYDLHTVANVLHTVEQDVRINHLHAAGFVAYEAGPAFDPAFRLHGLGSIESLSRFPSGRSRLTIFRSFPGSPQYQKASTDGHFTKSKHTFGQGTPIR